MKPRELMTREEARTAFAQLYRFLCEEEIPPATHALLRLTWSTDVSLSRESLYQWALCLKSTLFYIPLSRNAPDALRVAVAWWLKQPACVEAKVIVRKTRATKRGAYLQLMTTDAPHSYRELCYLSTNEDGKEVKYIEGPASKDWPTLMPALDPRLLIARGQEHLYTRDCYTLGTQLLMQAGGTLYWPGVWRLPLEAAQRVHDQVESLKLLLTSGSVTYEIIPIANTKENVHESD